MTLNVEDVNAAGAAPEPAPPPPTTTTTAKKPFYRRPWVLPLAAIVVVWLYLQVAPIVGVPEDQLMLPPHENFPAYYSWLITHMAGGGVAILTMCLQVWPWLRENHPKWHRVSGRIYMLGTLVSGGAGMVVVWWAPQPGKVGAVSMLVFWLAITTAAYVSVRRGNYATHRRFMLYSFAIPANNLWAYFTYVAITQLQIQIDFAYFIEYSRWVPWVGNLMLVQWWLYHTARRPAPVPSFVRIRS